MKNHLRDLQQALFLKHLTFSAFNIIRQGKIVFLKWVWIPSNDKVTHDVLTEADYEQTLKEGLDCGAEND